MHDSDEDLAGASTSCAPQAAAAAAVLGGDTWGAGAWSEGGTALHACAAAVMQEERGMEKQTGEPLLGSDTPLLPADSGA
jgi:hypothetical protein